MRIEDVDTPRCVAGAADTRSSRSWRRSVCVPDDAAVRQSQRDRAVPGGAAALAARAAPIRAAAAAATSRLAVAAPAGARDAPRRTRLSGHLPRRPARQAGARGSAARATPAPAAAKRRIDWHRPPPRRAAPGRRPQRRRLRAASAPTASGPISSRWWSTTPGRASPTSCAAKTWPTTRRGRSCCSGCSACRTPRYLHTPLVRAATATSCRSRRGAAPLDARRPARGAARRRAGARTGLARQRRSAEWLAAAIAAGASAPWRLEATRRARA